MMTSQKLYAILRKAGHRAAKWQPSYMVRGWGEYSPGVKVKKDSDTYKLWFNVTYESGHGAHAIERSRNAVQSYIVPALTAAGVQGKLTDDGLTFRVEE